MDGAPTCRPPSLSILVTKAINLIGMTPQTPPQDALQVANARRSKFHFTLNQDTTSYQKIGNTTFGSDGSSCLQIGIVFL